MTTRRTGTLLGMVAVVALVVVACLLLATGLGRGNAVAASPLVGHRAPDFTLPALPGTVATGSERQVRLSALRGQVVLVNFWASWCTECRDEQADLNRLWTRYRDARVVVVGVDFQDAAGDARGFVARSGATYPVVADRRSQTALAYGVRGIPETYLVAPDGRLVDRVVGAVDADRRGRRIDALLDGARS